MTLIALLWAMAAFAPQKFNPWFYLGRLSFKFY